ncbi:MAG: 50S ribosomal protein L18 [Gemmatimonadetes bacterium]|nr:50S ribosomal protein L18 [Gemmatimonadota bacterium]
MKSKTRQRELQRIRRHRRVRSRVGGTAERPRLVVHRSLKHLQGHLADDAAGRVLLGASTAAAELAELRANPEVSKAELSRAAGRILAQRAQAAGIRRVVFDRGGYLYHGRVAAFAQGAREGGLEF